VLRPICEAQGGKQVKPFSQKLLDAVLPHIRHRHGAVRLAVLEALEDLLLCGAGQSVETLVGWRLQNNVCIGLRARLWPSAPGETVHPHGVPRAGTHCGVLRQGRAAHQLPRRRLA
jgi:hypothetical protein